MTHLMSSPMDAIFLVDSSALHVAARAPFAYTPK